MECMCVHAVGPKELLTAWDHKFLRCAALACFLISWESIKTVIFLS